MEVISYNDPKSVVAESFKVLRTNLKFTSGGAGVETILVTSSLPGEGKSWVTGNLAVTYTQTGKRVVIVDSDMRKGRQHSIFHVDNNNGLSNFLACIYNDEEYSDNIRDILKVVSDEPKAYINKIIELSNVLNVNGLRMFIGSNFRIAFSNEGMKNVFHMFEKWKDAIMNHPTLENYFANGAKGIDIQLINMDAKEYFIEFAHELMKIKKEENVNDVEKYVKKTSVENLYIIPPGSVPPNPSELLDSERLPILISKLKEKFDVIIFDGTPCQLVADSLIVARHVDSVLLMVVYGQSKSEVVSKTKNDIEKAGSKVTGVVLNKVPNKKGYYGYYGYGQNESKKESKYKKAMKKFTSFF